MEYIQTYTAGWLSHRKALEQLLDAVSEEHLSFKPWEKAMSLSELVVHVVGATSMFVNIVKEGEHKPSAEQVKVNTLGELTAYVREQTEKTQATLEALTAQELERVVAFASMKMPGQAMLEMSKDHEIHHKGQLFTYARLCGIEKLPFFISR